MYPTPASIVHCVWSAVLVALLQLPLIASEDDESGTIRWTVDLGADIGGPPALGHQGDVYFQTSDGRMNAVSEAGAIRWRFATGGQAVSSPTVATDGSICFLADGTNGPAVFALSEQGEIRWTREIVGVGGGLAIAHDGTIYASVGSREQGQASLLALRPEDGSLVWATVPRRDVFSAPIVAADGTIYVAGFQDVHAFSSSGEPLWKADGSGDGNFHLRGVVMDSRGVLLIAGGGVHAFNPDGQVLWSYPYAWGGAGVGGVSMDGTIYSAGVSGPNAQKVVPLTPDGEKTWEFVIYGDCTGLCFDTRGTVYAATLLGRVYAISATGTQEWVLNLSGAVSSGLLLTATNTLFAGDSSGRLYAIRTAAGAPALSWPQMGKDPQRTGRTDQFPPSPASPTNLTATLRSRVTDVRLTWTSVLGASSYQLFRSTNSSLSDAVMIADVHDLQFDDFTAAPELPYTFWLRARNASGNSEFTPSVTGIRRQAIPGDLLYSWSFDGPVQGAPAIGSNGTVYVSVHTGVGGGAYTGRKVAALGPKGTRIWERDIGAHLLSPPSIGNDGAVYVGTVSDIWTYPGPPAVVALNPDSTVRWIHTTPGSIQGGVAVGTNDTVYFATSVGSVFAFLSTGAQLWETNLPGNHGLRAPPIIGPDGALYLHDADGRLHCLASDGALRWSLLIGTPLGLFSDFPGLAMDRFGTIYAAANNGMVAVRSDGTPKWKIAGRFYAGAAIDTSGNAIAGTIEGTLHAFNPSGAVPWTHVSSSGGHLGTPAVAGDGIIHVTTTSGRFLGFTGAGTNITALELSAASWSSPAIAPDGTVYVVTQDGKLHSFYGTAPLADTAWPMFQHDAQHSGRSPVLPLPLEPPELVAATKDIFTNRVYIAWESVPGAWYYDLWRAPAEDPGAMEQIAAKLTATNSFDDVTAAPGESYFYYVRAGNSFTQTPLTEPTIGSRRVETLPEPPPQLVSQPQHQTITVGSSATFNTAVFGTEPISYFWYLNGNAIPNAAGSNLTFRPVSLLSEGDYMVVVSNRYGAATSSVASLRISLPQGALRPNVFAWGANESGQGVELPTLTNIVAIGCGGSHNLAVTRTGNVIGWGDDQLGQATPPPALTNAVAVAGGDLYSLAVTSDGKVVGWGSTNWGESNPPNELSDVVDVAAGRYHSLALRRDGTVIAWGRSQYGQTNVPAGLTQVVAIAAGFYHSLALRSDGTLVSWGRTNFGQTQPPLDVTNTVAIASGYNHSMAISDEGELKSWGRNIFDVTQPPDDLKNVVAATGGDRHSIALNAFGVLTSWGTNDRAQLTIHPALTNVTHIAAGFSHSLALVGAGEPFILKHPLSSSSMPGEPTMFAVSATGELPLSFRWLKDGVPVSGATNFFLRLQDVQPQDAGIYTIEVSNRLGVASSAAELTVPSVTAIVAVASNGVLHLQWRSAIAGQLVVEQSSNLAEWTAILTNGGSSHVIEAVLPLSREVPAQFFRARRR